MLTCAYSMQQGEILFAKTGCSTPYSVCCYRVLLVDVESLSGFMSALIHISVISKAIAYVLFFSILFASVILPCLLANLGCTYLSLSGGIGVAGFRPIRDFIVWEYHISP